MAKKSKGFGNLGEGPGRGKSRRSGGLGFGSLGKAFNRLGGLGSGKGVGGFSNLGQGLGALGKGAFSGMGRLGQGLGKLGHGLKFSNLGGVTERSRKMNVGLGKISRGQRIGGKGIMGRMGKGMAGGLSAIGNWQENVGLSWVVGSTDEIPREEFDRFTERTRQVVSEEIVNEEKEQYWRTYKEAYQRAIAAGLSPKQAETSAVLELYNDTKLGRLIRDKYGAFIIGGAGGASYEGVVKLSQLAKLEAEEALKYKTPTREFTTFINRARRILGEPNLDDSEIEYYWQMYEKAYQNYIACGFSREEAAEKAIYELQEETRLGMYIERVYGPQ